MLGFDSFEDCGAHQDTDASSRASAPHQPNRTARVTLQPPVRPCTSPGSYTGSMSETSSAPVRLTAMAHGGGCACKIPPGELEEAVSALAGQQDDRVIVGLDDGDDAAAVRIAWDTAVLSTADFFTPVVDDPYDWGRIAAANALSDIYAMGGMPVVAINLVGWPREVLPFDMLREVLRGGLAVAQEAGCPVIGGHSVDDPEPKYGMAVTGTADPDKLLRNDAAEAGLPLTLTKPIGVGLLNNRHKSTGQVFPEAIRVMTQLNREASEQAVAAGIRAATDVTGFGLLGHLFKMARASGVAAEIDRAAVPLIDGAQDALDGGFISGGTRRNLDWVRPHLQAGPGISEEELLLLADAQTSGGLLVAGELPGHPVIGRLVAADADLPAGTISVR